MCFCLPVHLQTSSIRANSPSIRNHLPVSLLARDELPLIDLNIISIYRGPFVLRIDSFESAETVIIISPTDRYIESLCAT